MIVLPNNSTARHRSWKSIAYSVPNKAYSMTNFQNHVAYRCTLISHLIVFIYKAFGWLSYDAGSCKNYQITNFQVRNRRFPSSLVLSEWEQKICYWGKKSGGKKVVLDRWWYWFFPSPSPCFFFSSGCFPWRFNFSFLKLNSMERGLMHSP